DETRCRPTDEVRISSSCRGVTGCSWCCRVRTASCRREGSRRVRKIGRTDLPQPLQSVLLVKVAFSPIERCVQELDRICIVVRQGTSARRAAKRNECRARVVDRGQRNEEVLVTLPA